jgi:hypothetical protein
LDVSCAGTASKSMLKLTLSDKMSRRFDQELSLVMIRIDWNLL